MRRSFNAAACGRINNPHDIVPLNIIVITPWSRCGNVQHCPHGHSYFFNTGTEQTITGGRIQQNCGQGRPTHRDEERSTTKYSLPGVLPNKYRLNPITIKPPHTR